MDDLRILEFGSYLSAPLVGRFLASLGAHVTCIIRPADANGAMDERKWREPFWHDLSHRKRILEVDLVHEVDRRSALVADADVILINFAPGVSERLGIDYESCHRINPRAIYVSIPAYASGDAERRHVRAWDSMVMASSGVFRDMGLNRTLLGVEASFSSLPQASVYAAFFGLLSVLTAYHDDRWGEYIEVPMGSSVLEALVHNSIEFPANERYMNERARRIAKKAFPVTEDVLSTLMDPFFQKYMCLDGRPFYLVCPSHARHQKRAVKVLGIENETLKILPVVDPYTTGEIAHGIGTGGVDQDQAAKLRPLMENAFLKRSSADWEVAFGKAGVPGIAHKTTTEWITHPHAQLSHLVQRNDSGKLQICAPVWFERLRRTSYSSRENRKLDEFCVIDMTNVIAGPTIGETLSRFGCEVIKIDPTVPTYSPEIAVIYGLAANRGKRSLLLNAEHESGRFALLRLLAKADVLVLNCTEAAMRRIGLSPAELQLLFPELIVMRFDAWGGPSNKGQYNSYLGYDDNIQAGIGIMTRFGGGLDTAEEHAHVGTIDVIAGIGAAAGVVAALCNRKRGIVQNVRASLASIGQYVQYPFMFSEPEQLGAGTSCIGEHDLHRCVRCTDGWVVVTALLNINGIDRYKNELVRVFGTDDISELASRWTTDETVSRLTPLRIGAMPLCSMTQLKKKYPPVKTPAASGGTYQFIMDREHPIGTLIIAAPLAIRIRNAPYEAKMATAPKYGADTIDILNEIRCSRCLLLGAAALSWSHSYVPFQRSCDACHLSGWACVILDCEHMICHECLRRADAWKCPVCGCMHDVNIKRMRGNRDKFINGYSAWRRGMTRGANDRWRPTFEVKSPVPRSQSAPELRFMCAPHNTDAASSCLALVKLSPIE